MGWWIKNEYVQRFIRQDQVDDHDDDGKDLEEEEGSFFPTPLMSVDMISLCSSFMPFQSWKWWKGRKCAGTSTDSTQDCKTRDFKLKFRYVMPLFWVHKQTQPRWVCVPIRHTTWLSGWLGNWASLPVLMTMHSVVQQENGEVGDRKKKRFF